MFLQLEFLQKFKQEVSHDLIVPIPGSHIKKSFLYVLVQWEHIFCL